MAERSWLTFLQGDDGVHSQEPSDSEDFGADRRCERGARIVSADSVEHDRGASLGDTARSVGTRRWSLAARAAPVATVVLLCVAAGRWLLLLPDHRREGGGAKDAVDFVLNGWEPASITWKQHPEKCWNVRRPKGTRNGMKLQMWDCSGTQDKFMVPAGGFGPIKLASDPEYCLDAPGKSNLLQFWKCSEAPRENILFSVPTGRVGQIRPANDSSKCVDIPNGDLWNGRRVQQWNCSAAWRGNDMLFVIHWPVTCVWGAWSEWSACSAACTTTREMRQRVDRQDAVEAGHKDCDGVVKQVNSCQPKDCQRLDDEEKGEAAALDADGRRKGGERSGGGTPPCPALALVLGLLALPTTLRDPAVAQT